MIIWGSNGESLDLGKINEEQCKFCEKKRVFRLLFTYRWWALYWIFGLITKSQYDLVCEVCNKGKKISKEEGKAFNRDLNIPFQRRYGLLSLFIFFIGIATAGELFRLVF